MHLTLKLLLWPHISILFDRIFNHEIQKLKASRKKNCIILDNALLHLTDGSFFCSYLRVNQVSLQDIACVPQNACPTLTGKKKTKLLHLLQHLPTQLMLDTLEMHFQETRMQPLSLFLFFFVFFNEIHEMLLIEMEEFLTASNLKILTLFLSLPLTVRSSRVRTSTKTSRCRSTWRSTSSSCCTLAFV